VAESPIPVKSGVAAGVRRKFDLKVPGGFQAWLLAGATGGQPRAFDASGAPVRLDLTAAIASAPGTARIVLPDADRAVVLDLVDAPAGTTWRFVPRSGGGWLAVVRLPMNKDPLPAVFALTVWGVPKDDDGLVKDLGAK
jgi:hypothetical protein